MTSLRAARVHAARTRSGRTRIRHPAGADPHDPGSEQRRIAAGCRAPRINRAGACGNWLHRVADRTGTPPGGARVMRRTGSPSAARRPHGRPTRPARCSRRLLELPPYKLGQTAQFRGREIADDRVADALVDPSAAIDMREVDML